MEIHYPGWITETAPSVINYVKRVYSRRIRDSGVDVRDIAQEAFIAVFNTNQEGCRNRTQYRARAISNALASAERVIKAQNKLVPDERLTFDVIHEVPDQFFIERMDLEEEVDMLPRRQRETIQRAYGLNGYLSSEKLCDISSTLGCRTRQAGSANKIKAIKKLRRICSRKGYELR